MENREETSLLDDGLALFPRLTAAALIAMDLALFMVEGQYVSSFDAFRIQQFILGTAGLAILVWVVANWHAAFGLWAAIGAVTAALYMGYYRLGSAGFLAFAPLVVGLTAPLGSPLATIGIALPLTASLLALPAPMGVDPLAPFLAGVTSLTAALLIASLFRPLQKTSEWYASYYEKAERMVAEALDQRAELTSALEQAASANRQLALATERMASLRAIAEEAQRAKAAFVANVSHEFRTPLNMIIGLVEVMVETPEIYAVSLSPKMREDLAVVYRNCEHLVTMINDVLDLTQMEAGRMVLHRERIAIEPVIHNAVAAIVPLIEKKGLAIDVDLPPDLPAIYCDRTRIRQVILNLVSNAARFTESGGIRVRARQVEQSIRITVADSGPGIAPEDVERVFEPFCQGSDSLWRDKGGTGLGLSVSRDFVALHGGHMKMESELGAGTVVTFSLPISPPVHPVGRPGHQIREDWVWRERTFLTNTAIGDDLTRPRVIVLDAMGGLARELTRVDREQIEFVAVEDVQQATSALDDCPAHAALVNAPRHHLWPLVDALRATNRGLPVFGCSIRPRPSRASQVGAHGYLVKPVTRRRLQQTVESLDIDVRRVLIVDDDPDVLQVFTRMLQALDPTLEITTASDGAQALSMARHTAPDLALIDLVLPGEDGWAVWDRLRSLANDHDMRAVFVSAQDPDRQPTGSRHLILTIDEGLAIAQVLDCLLGISVGLLHPAANR